MRTSEPRTSVRAPQSVRLAPLSRGGIYLLTWTTHGTWLPGDPRGFVSRVPTPDGHAIHNKVGTPFDRDMPVVLQEARKRTKSPEVWLSAEHAEVCASSFQEAAQNAEARIGAYAIMRGHCHVVVRTSILEGAETLRRLKGVSARRLTQAFGKPPAISWWTRNGSHRLLTNSPSIQGAIRYVLQQEKPLVIYRAPPKPMNLRPLVNLSPDRAD